MALSWDYKKILCFLRFGKAENTASPALSRIRGRSRLQQDFTLDALDLPAKRDHKSSLLEFCSVRAKVKVL